MTTAPTTIATPPRSRKKPVAIAPAPSIAALQVSVLQEHLKRALAKAQHAVAPKSTLPVLSHVLLVADGSHLAISATNLEVGIVATIAAQVTRPGAITLPAKLLSDVVAGLPNETITIVMDTRTQRVQLTCGAFEANINGMAAEEFPTIPTLATWTPTATFAPEALCSAISQVAFAAGSDDTRPVLTGMRIKLAGMVASFAAADGFRMAFRTIALERAVTHDQQVVVPARAMTTLGKVLSDVDGAVEQRIDQDSVIFRADGVELVARCIDGAYPTIDRYLNLTFGTVLEIETKELARAVKLAAFFATSSSNVVRLQLARTDTGGQLTVSANAAEVGDNCSAHAATIHGTGGTATIPYLCPLPFRLAHAATIHGTGGTVALNAAFLADGIAAIATPQIAIHYTTAQQPIVLKGIGDETYTHVAMPMTVK
jgi:DNA polymerase-3 subunit beta